MCYRDRKNLRKLLSVDGPGNTTDFAYDGEGRRVKKVSAAETTIFVYDASGVLIAEYSGEVASEPRVSYLTTDHLGSPRVVTDERGSVASRRDFMPFGEEINGVGGRTTGLNYGSDNIRQKFTGYERDTESDLDFAQARYYNSSHGRFTSVDPLTASASTRNPQTLNRYSYGLNSPYKFTDPLGLLSEYTTGACGGRCPNSDGSSGGWSSDYYSGQLNGPQEQMIKEFIGLFGQAAWDALVTGEPQQKPQQPRQAPDVSDPNELCNPYFEFQESPGTTSAAQTSSSSGGPVIVINGNPLQRTASGGLSIKLDRWAAFFFSHIASEAAEHRIEIQTDTTISLELTPDGGFYVSADRPIHIGLPGPVDVRLSRVTFDANGLVTSTIAKYSIFDVSAKVRANLNAVIKSSMYGSDPLGNVMGLSALVRRASASLYGRRTAPLRLDIDGKKKQ